MHVTATLTPTARLPLEQVLRSSQAGEAEKIRALSRGFEAILLRNILENAQKPLLDGGGDAPGAGIYRDLVTSQLADALAGAQGLGLASELQRQLLSKPDAAGPQGEPAQKTS